MRSRYPTMRPTPTVYWLSFLDWLSSGVWGVLPFTLHATLGPVGLVLPLARHVAQALGPWLLTRLAERLTPPPPTAGIDPALARRLAADLDARPLRVVEVRPDLSWLGRKLEVELGRLTRLIEAPSEGFCRPDWLAWEVRFWALVISLTRIGQLYFALERLHSPQVAEQVFWQVMENIIACP